MSRTEATFNRVLRRIEIDGGDGEISYKTTTCLADRRKPDRGFARYSVPTGYLI
jgi:hypothetical protein